MEQQNTLRPRLNNLQWVALAAGIVGLALSAVGYFTNQEQFFRSYLLSYVFWIELSVGAVAVLLIQHLAGGRWGMVIQRILEAGAMTLPIMAALFVPLLFGLPALFEWARPEAVAHDALLQHKAPYLNVPFFMARAAIYFVVWIVIAFLLTKWSVERDKTGDAALTKRLKNFSGPAMWALAITATFASFDWMMSLEPQWFSTIYGMMFIVGAMAAAFAFATLVLARVAGEESLAQTVNAQQFNDLGNFLLTMVIMWTYIALSQYLIIWLGNLKEEIPWYLVRGSGSWATVSQLLIAFHFVIPFFILLSRSNKRQPKALTMLGLFLLLARFIDIYWLIVPAFRPDAVFFHWLDAAALLGVGGIWMAAFYAHLKKHALVPRYDPRLEDAAPRGRRAPSEA